jgi:hypothetical protein
VYYVCDKLNKCITNTNIYYFNHAKIIVLHFFTSLHHMEYRFMRLIRHIESKFSFICVLNVFLSSKLNKGIKI